MPAARSFKNAGNMDNCSDTQRANSSTACAPYSNWVLTTKMWYAEISGSGIVAVISCVLTSLVLLTYALDNGLYRNHFHIYVISLLISDFLYFTTLIPSTMYLVAYPALAQPAWFCPVFEYFLYVTAMLPPISHFLISLNRTWALVFPQSYRTRHTRRLALLAILMGVLLAHASGLPPLLVEWLRYGYTRLPSCIPNVQDPVIRAYGGIWLGLLCTFEMFIISSYPILLKRQRMRMRPSGSAKLSVAPESAIPNDGRKAESKRERESNTHAFKALTLLVMAVLLGWTPSHVYTWLVYLNVQSYDPHIMAWLSFMTDLDILLDPLIFLVALKDLRNSFSPRLQGGLLRTVNRH